MKKLTHFSLALVSAIAFANLAHARAGGPVGGNKDASGCSVSSGATWSVLKNACIRVFSSGSIALLPVNKTGSATFAAYALFNDDKTKVEVFVPQKASTILEQTADNKNIWATGEWSLENGGSYILKKNGVPQYSN